MIVRFCIDCFRTVCQIIVRVIEVFLDFIIFRKYVYYCMSKFCLIVFVCFFRPINFPFFENKVVFLHSVKYK